MGMSIEQPFTSDWPEELCRWFSMHRRPMPWRESPTPYHVLVSEFMLQQTQVATVIPYYHRFIGAFPTLKTLADAPEESVLKLWEGLGYYSRARHLHVCAKAISEDRNGQFPSDYETLLGLAGIGPYTAAAIASIAFNQPVAVVDGNVLRVRSRMTADETPIGSSTLKSKYFKELTAILQHGSPPAIFNQAIMELGSLVCTPSSPDCAHCPVAKWCSAFSLGRQCDFPVKTPTKTKPHYEVAVGLVYSNDRLLILKRTDGQMLAGLWEFPGGKLEDGETPQMAVKREILEETALHVAVKEKIATIRHAYSHFSITMHAFRCSLTDDCDTPQCDRPWHWIREQELHSFPFPKANHKLFAKMNITDY